MRSIVNLSLPAETVKMIKREVKKNKYVSVSEFFRALLREYEEDILLAELKESEREFRAGKGKVLRSFKDLR
ncbi:ribbon-helix-helix domain-containing protein [Patescibacteria group bacterium]|nr:ribbon-helix-helix domain-containing protein [Patescibacteria group bacterium]MBU1563668.1 ribbon-helix-helix domain-containing protein [Patescibacteria group bacterium]MBU2068323.1 ribbon-helix-helix domain-containing protein [Patescibacteria group bacterium]